eukprot:15436198-Alexandrium_andersonii.AAC.1
MAFVPEGGAPETARAISGRLQLADFRPRANAISARSLARDTGALGRRGSVRPRGRRLPSQGLTRPGARSW